MLQKKDIKYGMQSGAESTVVLHRQLQLDLNANMSEKNEEISEN